MGVKNFFKIKFIKDETEYTIDELGEEVNLKKFNNEKICIDASLILYQSILSAERINSLTDAEGETTVHINTIFNKIIQLKQAGIIQIWIFDSPIPNEIKKRELEKRKERRENATDEKTKYKLNKKHIEEIQYLLTNLGIMYIISPPGVEAEQYGSYLTKGNINERFCKYMITGDSDVLFFGGNLLRIISTKTAKGKSKKTIYKAYELDDILNDIDITIDQFLKIGVIMGTDFNDKAPGIGPATVIKKVKKDIAHITPAMENAINYYKSDISEKISNDDTQIVNGIYDRIKIIEFLVSKKFNKERVESRLDDFEKGQKTDKKKTDKKENDKKETK